MKNESLLERVKSGSRKTFIGVGNMAVGNAPSDKSGRGNIEPMPFSWIPAWLHEKPMPKRKDKR